MPLSTKDKEKTIKNIKHNNNLYLSIRQLYKCAITSFRNNAHYVGNTLTYEKH